MQDQRLNIGGLQVGGPRTAQNPARFRVANNVYQTLDDYLVPRFHGSIYQAFNLSGIARVAHVARYKKNPVIMGIKPGSYNWAFFNANGFEVPIYLNPPDINSFCSATYQLFSSAPQFVEKLGNLYIGLPNNNLLKFDGVQVYQAGVPLPYFSCAQYAGAGTTFVRVVQHHLDFQGNNVNSGYVEFPCTPSAGNITLRVDNLATDIIANNTGMNPKVRPTYEKFDGTFDQFFYIGSAKSVDTGNKTITFTTGGNHGVKLDAYILAHTGLSTAANNSLGDAYAIALRVDSFTATTVTLSLNGAKYLDANREWRQGNMSATAPLLATLPLEGCNYWMSVWSSTASTATYVYKGVVPAFYNSTVSKSYTVSVATPTTPASGYDTLPWVIAPILGDFYDVTSLKGVLPRNTAFSNPNSCFTTYGDTMLSSTVNEVYFSDSTLGGSFEMVNALSFIVVGESDDGDVTSVCGNADFILVSRQYKNYIVAGNLPTANYRVSAIKETSLGCYSNESSIDCEDKIIFFNKQGIWALYNGGRCEQLSFNIKGLFENYSNTVVYDEEEYFDITVLPTYAGSTAQDKWVRLRKDVNRGLLTFSLHGDGQGQILVLNLNNGEFYTWSGMLSGYADVGANKDFKDILFIDGNYYVTGNGDSGVYLYKEDKTIPRVSDYLTDPYMPTLKTTWKTDGNPSLEKKFNQVKLWGIVNGTLSMSYELDFKTDASYGTSTYANSNDSTFGHKKRLKPANYLGISVAIKVTSLERFELEGIEIEWSTVQESMKK